VCQKPRWIEPFGLAALLSGGAALLCASGSPLCRFVLPLGAAALILGQTGLLRALALRRSRLLFSFGGISLGAVIVCAASLSPDLLGPVFVASRAKDLIDPAAIRAVPLPDKPGTAAPESPDWVDASRAALQQGGINVQVVSASIRRVGSKAATNKVPSGDYHFVRLRTQQVEAAGDPAAKRQPSPAVSFENADPRLTDGAGKVYRLFDVQDIEALPNERRSSVFPVAFQEHVLVFEAPTRPEDLRLELPAKAWGGAGAFRFTIPGSMSHDERPRTPGSRPR
jgi:hypothetical protein